MLARGHVALIHAATCPCARYKGPRTNVPRISLRVWYTIPGTDRTCYGGTTTPSLVLTTCTAVPGSIG
eukprot:3385947-Rhodomonas_salina.1